MSGQITKSLSHLAAHGWIPLRSMSCLLGYAHPTGVYARQRGKNPIPVVKVGGTFRVHVDDVLYELHNVPEEDQIGVKGMLQLYNRLLKEQSKNE